MTTQNRITGVQSLCLVMLCAAVLGLSGCGGGGSPIQNDFNRPPSVPPLNVSPGTFTAYFNQPVLMIATGGRAPYQLVSNNTAIIPAAESAVGSFLILPANVAQDQTVQLTVVDSSGQRATANATVRPAPLVSNMTVLGEVSDCGGDAQPDPVDGVLRLIGRVCSGQTGIVRITARNPAGGGIAGRQIRFNVVEGTYSLLSGDPAQPRVNERTITTDQNGIATIRIQTNENSPTAYALISATDVLTGNRVTSGFAIVQQVSQGPTLTVIPTTATITAFFVDECSAGVPITYYIFGGTPPYRVQTSFTSALTILNPVVPTNGGGFTVVTNGTCVNPATFVVTDATGRTNSEATLINQPGTTARPTPPPPPPVVNPSTVCLAPGASTQVTVIGQGAAGAATTTVVVATANPSFVTATPPTGATPLVVTITRQPAAPNGVDVPITFTTIGGSTQLIAQVRATCP